MHNIAVGAMEPTTPQTTVPPAARAAQEKHEARIRRWLENLQDERDGIALYVGLAAAERDPARAKEFEALAAGERRHAGIWERKLRAAGRLPPEGPPSARVRAIVGLARMFGTTSVLPIVIRTESGDASKYARQPGVARALVQEEQDHRAVLEKMAGLPVTEGGAEITERERWHLVRGGSIRAAVFGINDGLVSNVALILGVAAAGSGDAGVALAGLAGAAAGAFSMASGEYVSVASQRDLLKRQIALERRELFDAPEEEQEELELILKRKGLDDAQAREVAAQLFKDPEKALDTMVREELGLDPKDLGSPLGAAVPSFFAFAFGALVPLIPYTFLDGLAAAATAAAIAGVILAAVGALIGFLSGTGAVRSGARMVGLAGLAAAVTIALGRLIGGTLAG